MTVRISVCYGKPDDPKAFDEYYERVHIPLANRVPGLKDFTWGKTSSIDGSEAPYYAIANLFFDEEDVKTALASEEMKAAGADVQNFATGGVTMFLQKEKSVRA